MHELCSNGPRWRIFVVVIHCCSVFVHESQNNRHSSSVAKFRCGHHLTQEKTSSVIDFYLENYIQSVSHHKYYRQSEPWTLNTHILFPYCSENMFSFILSPFEKSEKWLSSLLDWNKVENRVLPPDSVKNGYKWMNAMDFSLSCYIFIFFLFIQISQFYMYTI